MSNKYRYTLVFEFEAIDDVEAKEKVTKARYAIGLDPYDLQAEVSVEVSDKLQEVYLFKGPRLIEKRTY